MKQILDKDINQNQAKTEQKIKLLKTEKDKYLLKFPNIDIPVEVNAYIYNQIMSQDNPTN